MRSIRELMRQSRQFQSEELVVLAHQDVVDWLLEEEASVLAELETQLGRPIRLQAEPLYGDRPVRRGAGMKVAARPDDQSVWTWRATWRTARRLLREAAGAGAQLAVLPENFALMSRQERDKRAIAEPDGERDPSRTCWPPQRGSWRSRWSGGTIPLLVPGETRVAAASLVYGPDGNRLGRYDKIHLFDVNVPGAAESHRESAGMTPGREVVVVPTPVGRVGVAVCYDLRFPELFRQMMRPGGGFLRRVRGLHGAHRRGALEPAAARAGGREPLPPRGLRTGGRAREWPQDLWPQRR